MRGRDFVEIERFIGGELECAEEPRLFSVRHELRRGADSVLTLKFHPRPFLERVAHGECAHGPWSLETPGRSGVAYVCRLPDIAVTFRAAGYAWGSGGLFVGPDERAYQVEHGYGGLTVTVNDEPVLVFSGRDRWLEMDLHASLSIKPAAAAEPSLTALVVLAMYLDIAARIPSTV